MVEETHTGIDTIRELLQPDPALIETVVCAERPWRGRIFEVETSEVLCPDGSHDGRELARHHGGAGVCVIRDDHICLVRQWRVSLGRMALEIPAGKLDDDEDPMLCAARELTEETGLVADSLELLADSCGALGFTDECTHVYLAHGVRRHAAHPDEGEFVDVVWVPVEDMMAAIQAGIIQDSKTIVALCMAREVMRRQSETSVGDDTL
jgi:ADP-ribose pyrophosphatase